MKKAIAFILAALMLLGMCACGRKKDDQPTAPGSAPAETPQVYEVKITPENFLSYFEYREFRSDTKSTDGDNTGEVTSAQISYGFALREGYTAANDPEYEDTLEIGFAADGVVKSGSFSIDFDTLQYTGETVSTETVPVTGTLSFWPKGDRTTVWAYGNYSDSYIIYLENFSITSVKGSVFIKQTGGEHLPPIAG